MKTLYILIIILILLFGAIAGVVYLNNNSNKDEPLIGGDKDEHGCMLMAGYTWNETKQECVREWEETLKQACIELGCPPNTFYVGSSGSDKYYECKCGWAKTIKSENLVCFSSNEEALSDNRVKSEC